MGNLEIKRPTEKDYAELMDMLDTSFSFCDEESKFIRLLPKLYKLKYKPWDNNICVFENGKIAAGVGLYYLNLNVCGENLKVGGIGNVAVHPSARRKGYMKGAMLYAENEMLSNGTDLSVLDGQRQRYQYFGYDNVGVSYSFCVTRTNLRHTFGENCQTDVTAVKLAEDDTSALDMIWNMNKSRPLFCERKREDLFDILHSWFATPYKLCKDGKDIGYFVISKGMDSVNEFSLISSDYTRDAVIAVFNLSEAQSVAFVQPVYETKMNDFLFNICDFPSVKGSCKISVFNYKNTVSAFLKLKAFENKLPDTEFTCLIHGIKGDENLTVTVKDGVPTAELTDKKADIELSHLEAGSFFFSYYSDKRRNLVPEIASVLPLPFFVPSQDHV